METKSRKQINKDYYLKNHHEILKNNKKYKIKAKVNRTFYDNFVRPTILRIKGKICEVCSSTDNIELHHTDYEIININTLQVVCKSCHKSIHNKPSHSHLM